MKSGVSTINDLLLLQSAQKEVSKSLKLFRVNIIIKKKYSTNLDLIIFKKKKEFKVDGSKKNIGIT